VTTPAPARLAVGLTAAGLGALVVGLLHHLAAAPPGGVALAFLFVGLPRLGRSAAVVGAAVVAGVAVTTTALPPGLGLLLGALAGLAAAWFSGRSGEPGPDTPDTDTDTDGADGGD
jgi:hypothetical protein